MDLNNLKFDPIVVVGGGFAGLATVQALLAKANRTPVLLIDQSPRFLFKPFLYELLSGELQLWEVAPQYSSLAAELGFIFIQDCVVEINEQERKVITLSDIELTYSQLVISTGVQTDYSFVEGLKEYAHGFSTLNDLQKIKKFINRINKSNESKKPFVICGAGPTGVELACKVADMIDNRVEIYLVDKGEKILSQSRSFNREKAINAISKRHIKLYLKHDITCINETFIELSNSANQIKSSLKINYSDLVWTAALKPSPMRLVDCFLDENKKIKVNKFLQINEYKNIFFIGDITFCESNPYPSSAQVAMHQGFLTAQNIIALQNKNKLRPFEFEDRGEMLSLGVRNASITGYGITMAGPLAFEIRRLAYLMRMPGFSLAFKSTGSWMFSKQIINRLFSQYP